jgi:hypothetical protein
MSQYHNWTCHKSRHADAKTRLLATVYRTVVRMMARRWAQGQIGESLDFFQGIALPFRKALYPPPTSLLKGGNHGDQSSHWLTAVFFGPGDLGKAPTGTTPIRATLAKAALRESRIPTVAVD